MKTPDTPQSQSDNVSLREHVTARIDALDRHLTAEIDALRRETHAANETAENAVGVAAHEAQERLVAHNGLIAQMREQAAHFASQSSLEEFKKTNDTRLRNIERFQAMLMGGLVLVSAIGIANLVKVWSPAPVIAVERPFSEARP